MFHHDRIFKTRGLADNLPKWKRIVVALVDKLKELDGAQTYVEQVAELNATFQALAADARSIAARISSALSACLSWM